MKYFYSMEKNWGFSGSSAADTADQDQDKTKTYDLCRVEYAHLDAILFAGECRVTVQYSNLAA